jgi:hypothetical protein
LPRHSRNHGHITTAAIKKRTQAKANGGKYCRRLFDSATYAPTNIIEDAKAIYAVGLLQFSGEQLFFKPSPIKRYFHIRTLYVNTHHQFKYEVAPHDYCSHSKAITPN